MRAAGKVDHGNISAEQSVDIGEMLLYRDLIAFALILLVPLVVIVKYQRYDVVEVVDEAIWRCRVDEAMEPAIKVGKIVKPALDLVQKISVFFLKNLDLLPERRILRQGRESPG